MAPNHYRPWQRLALVWLLLGVAACSARPHDRVLVPQPGIPDWYPSATIVTATDRQRSAASPGYSSKRSPKLRFERFTVAMVAIRNERHGQRQSVTFAGSEKYLVRDRKGLSDIDALQHRKTVVYVHGYNYTFQESLFQISKVAIEGRLKETPVLFSWPSEGTITGYIADKDAALYARDDLTNLLIRLGKNGKKGGITLFGHSTGAWLVLEALRQLKLTNRDDVLGRIDQVVLAAPDIEVDLFGRQVRTIGRLAQPIILLNAKDDRALALSSRLAGSRPRIGAVDRQNATVKELAAEGMIEVIDLSRLPAPDQARHRRFVRLAQALSMPGERTDLPPQAGLRLTQPSP